jgi:formylglycine-generating enzyme required for sulfatase activity
MTEANIPVEKPLKKRITNQIGMEFVLVPGGEFIMGTEDLVEDPSDLEAVAVAVREAEAKPGFSPYDFAPRHRVTIQPFYMGRYPVTQAQWTGSWA